MLLFTGSLFTQLLFIAVVSCITVAQHYEVHDDEESDSNRGKDYSKYYASGTAPSGGQASAAEETGFVRPLDFSALFGTSGLGFGGDPAGSTQIFRPANTEVGTFGLPVSHPVFPLQGSASNKNENNGFTSSDAGFHSLFDASVSPSEVGFRPQDFIRPAAINDDDKESEGSSNSGFYSPSFSKFDEDYHSKPGPHYTHHAVPAAAEHNPKKSSYKHESESSEEDEDEDDDSSEYKSSPSEDNYEEKSAFKPSPTDSYSFKPSNYKYTKPEYTEGKSSYPSPTYKPVYISPKPDSHQIKPTSKTLTSSTAKPTHGPTSHHFPSKGIHRPLTSEHLRAKPTFSTPSSGVYPTPPVYKTLPTGQIASKYRFSPNIDGKDVPIIYGKGKAPAYEPSSTQVGKSVYTQSFPKDVYNDKYVPKPSPTSQSNFQPGTLTPFTIGSTSFPSTKPTPSSAGSPTNKEEVYQEEAAGHGPPEYTPSGSKTNKKKCKKIQKRLTADDVAKGRFRRDAMTCYQCEDPKTGTIFEKCAYTSDPNSKSFFSGHTQKYSTGASANKPTTFRYRRYLSRDPFGLEAEEEELVAEETRSRFVRQSSGFEYTSEGDKDDKGDYRFGPEYFTSGSDDIPEYKPSETKIDKKHCKKTQKDSMICMVCKDPKTGGSYEQCSYSEKPKKNNYFVAHESRLSKGKPYTETQTGYEPPAESHYRPRSRHVRQQPSSERKTKSDKPSVRSKIEEKFGVPYELEASSKSESKSDGRGGVGLDPFLYGEPEPYNQKATDKDGEKDAEGTDHQDSFFPGGKSYEEYFRHLFPELHEEKKGSASSDLETYEYPSSATKSEKKIPGFEYKSSLPEFFTDNEPKKDLDKVVGEFSQKDRTSCKKIVKDQMTCYKCYDNKGMQHEECIYVAASEPKKSHLAYHETKEYKLVPDDDGKESASSNLPVASDSEPSYSSDSSKSSTDTTDESSEVATTTVTPKPRRKSFFKKASSPTTPTPVADNKYDETTHDDILKLDKDSAKEGSEKRRGANVKVSRRSSKTTVLTTSTPQPESSSLPTKKRRQFKKAVSTDSTPASSEPEEKKVKKSSQETQEPKLSASDLSPDGYFAAETKAKFDPVLKVHLPEYMLTKSEHEAVFDEVMASGRRR